MAPIEDSEADAAAEPLRGAVAAFEDADQLWHDAADAYHEPTVFRRHAEGLIQATRNVTWRLQAAKNALPHFDDWYSEWQDLIKSDDRLRWLNNARIDVVKRGGLRAESYAIVRIIDSYLEPASQLLRLPATTPTIDLVLQAQRAIPASYSEHVAIEITRRWVAEGRNDELLSVIAHCLHVLDALLIYASEVVADEPPAESPRNFVDLVRGPDCMVMDPSWIPLLFEADTGEEFRLGFGAIAADPAIQKVGAARYGVTQGSIDSTDPMERAEQLHKMARTMFKRDGFCVPVVELRGPAPGSVALFSLAPTDKRYKFLVWHALGHLVQQKGYTSVIATAEIWMAPTPEQIQPYHDVEHAAGRQEALATWVDTQEGSAKLIESRIIRLLGKPHLKSPTNAGGRIEDGFLSPIHRAWAAGVAGDTHTSSVVHGSDPTPEDPVAQ